MLESLVRLARESTYDFRATANLDDPLRERFPEWIPYYRLKWAIARHLQPASILEIGVRYGYSAAAFLDAAPGCAYTGIDLDNDQFGGVRGAIEWAKRITAGRKAEFIVGDSQKMDRFPAARYDLIHVDGQQDGDGSFHDLRLAVRQARYVLVDGYLWTRQNFLSVSEFLFQYRDLIEFYGVVPGYAGELLIKVAANDDADASADGPVSSSADLREAYSKTYYTEDCGGHESYRKLKGKRLEDPRLQAVALLASARSGGRAVDLGCGRGEMSYYLADQGFTIDAVDYSADAIELARACFEDEPVLRERVTFHCADLSTFAMRGPYDLAVASDLIEHLTPAEVAALYAKVARHLTPDGLFVLHTFPNFWMYRYEHARRRRVAASVGAYLPAQPRSRYEQLLHINEQSPRVMKRQLKAAFPHVVVRCADLTNFGPALAPARAPHSYQRAAPELFAVASHRPIPEDDIRRALSTAPLPAPGPAEIAVTAVTAPDRVACGGTFELEVEVRNGSAHPLKSLAPFPVYLSYHWLDEGGQVIEFEGWRSALLPLVPPGGRLVARQIVRAPARAGRCTLRITLVQEGIRWYDQLPDPVAANLEIHVG
jgi:SAM-dependent methyltransferase